MPDQRPTINIDAPPGYQEIALDRHYDRASAMIEKAPDPTDGAYDRLRAARDREAHAKAMVDAAYRDLVMKVACAPGPEKNEMAIRLWASRLASLTAFYISEVLAVHAAQADANRALREMSPAVPTRPDEVTQ